MLGQHNMIFTLSVEQLYLDYKTKIDEKRSPCDETSLMSH